MNKGIEQVLDFDPFSEAEKITGNSYKTDTATDHLGIILHLENSAKKEALLGQSGDTYYRLSFSGHLKVFKELGFEIVARHFIPDTVDQWAVLWRNGILIFCESYNGDNCLNSGNAYFNCKGDRPYRCSSSFIEEVDGQPVWAASLDVREGFKTRLERIEASSEILPRWLQRPFLWLLHYKETRTQENYQKINAERIAMLPEFVQDAIKGSNTIS